MYLPTHYAFVIVIIILLESSALFVYTLIGLIKANPLPFLLPTQPYPLCHYGSNAPVGAPDQSLGGNIPPGMHQLGPIVRTVAVTSIATSTTILTWIYTATATATLTSVQMQVSSDVQTSVQTQSADVTPSASQSQRPASSSATASLSSKADGLAGLLPRPTGVAETKTITTTVPAPVATAPNPSQSMKSEGASLIVTVRSTKVLQTTLSEAKATASVVLVTSYVDVRRRTVPTAA